DRCRIRIDAHVAHRLSQLFCDGERIGKIMLGEEAKFLTAQTPADACASSQLRRDCNNHSIAEMMAVSVVHPLEKIDVEHDGRQLHASHRLPGDLLRALKEFPAIEQAAERIDGCVAYQLALHAGDPVGDPQARAKLSTSGGLTMKSSAPRSSAR